MEILNYTPNTVNVYSGADLDPTTKKWKGGHLINTFPSVGILNARMEEITEYIKEDGIIFKRTRIVNYSCDLHPVLDQDNIYFIVTRVYLAVAKQKGWDTSHLLTVGGTVVDDDGNAVGTAFLNMN